MRGCNVTANGCQLPPCVDETPHGDDKPFLDEGIGTPTNCEQVVIAKKTGTCEDSAPTCSQFTDRDCEQVAEIFPNRYRLPSDNAVA